MSLVTRQPGLMVSSEAAALPCERRPARHRAPTSAQCLWKAWHKVGAAWPCLLVYQLQCMLSVELALANTTSRPLAAGFVAEQWHKRRAQATLTARMDPFVPQYMHSPSASRPSGRHQTALLRRRRLVTSSSPDSSWRWSASACSRHPAGLVTLAAPVSRRCCSRLLPLTAGSDRKRGRSSSSQAKKAARRAAQLSSCAAARVEQLGEAVERHVPQLSPVANRHATACYAAFPALHKCPASWLQPLAHLAVAVHQGSTQQLQQEGRGKDEGATVPGAGATRPAGGPCCQCRNSQECQPARRGARRLQR